MKATAKKSYRNKIKNIKGKGKSKEELLKEIEELQQRIDDLEKLSNKPQNIKEETEQQYPELLEEPVTTCTLKKTVVNEQILREINNPQKATKRLFEIKGNYEKICSIIPNALIIADEKGKIIFWNKAAEKIFGYTSEEALNNDLFDILIPSEYHQFFKEGFNRFKDTGEGPIIGKPSEFIAKKKNGNNFPIEITLSAIEVDKKWHSVAIIRDISERKRIEKSLIRTHQKLEGMLNNAVNTLVKIIELRDSYTSGHQKRVSELAVAIARKMELNEKEVKLIKIAALVHDIGKAGIPSEILNKPSKLTELEFNLIQAHPQAGYNILKEVNFPWPVEEIILQHHERIDGSGYPRRLKDDEIMVEARIIAVADVVDAMSSHRPYRPALGIKKALEEISQNRDILYDPKVADTCLKLFRKKKFKF
ncbi:MAG TPA: hypothetical protein DHW70_04455 [Candidatus Atribacteria bacterium]|nr:hypothetical protein [Candidatus Atribacteria bacterium]